MQPYYLNANITMLESPPVDFLVSSAIFFPEFSLNSFLVATFLKSSELYLVRLDF